MFVPNRQGDPQVTDVQGSPPPGSSVGKALHMNHHAWASKQLIVSIALAVAFAPALTAAESTSRLHLDGKTASVGRASELPGALDHSSGAQEAAPQTSPQASPTAAEQPTVKAPQVTYEDGQLTVIAENSSLSEVMRALRSALGADIDLPADIVDQHIWVHLGPGPARRVLRDLLDDTEFNYVMQASDSDPDGIRSVLLTPRSKSTGAETAGSPERSAMRRTAPPPRTGSEAASATESENPPAETAASVDPSQAASPAALAATPATAAATPAAAVNASSANLQYIPGNAASAALSPPPPSDPNQMIQTLQSMYEQRRQMQQQQNQKPAGQK